MERQQDLPQRAVSGMLARKVEEWRFTGWTTLNLNISSVAPQWANNLAIHGWPIKQVAMMIPTS